MQVATVALAEIAKQDFRDVAICEEFPEEFLGGPARATAAAELVRRYEALGFPVPAHTVYWAKEASSVGEAPGA